MLKTFFGGKKIYITLALLLAVGGVVWRQYQKKSALPDFAVAAVERGTLVQTVEATGKIEAKEAVSLRFEIPGMLDTVKVAAGQTTIRGQILATLRLKELDARVAEASATLQQKLAGATDESKASAQAALTGAEVAWQQSKIDAETAVRTAASALETARNNLQLASGGEESQIITAAYETAVATLKATLPKLDDALTQADNILGVDNRLANDSFESTLASLDTQILTRALALYVPASQAVKAARLAVEPLTPKNPHAAVDAAFPPTEAALTALIELLQSVSVVLGATPPVGSLTPTTLDSKKTTIETIRATITAQHKSVIAERQNITDARSSLTGYTIAFNKAEQDLTQATANADSSVKIKEVGYLQAKANFQATSNPPRAVDVAPLRAVLAAAQAARDKGILRAPLDGVVTAVNKKSGELVTSADVVVELLSPHYQVTVDVPETDIGKIAWQQKATVTLDAFSDRPLTGAVVAIDPASTEVQDVVYYTVTVALDPSEVPVRAGLTATVSIRTAERPAAIFVPVRALRTRAGEKYVRILAGKEVREVPVRVGLKTTAGVEILSGLTEGQIIIVGEPEKSS